MPGKVEHRARRWCFAYRLRQIEVAALLGFDASVVEWGEAVEGSARELLAEMGDEGEGGAGKDAETFLKALLSNGPMSAAEIREAAETNSIAWRTVERAKKTLGVKSVQSRKGWS